MNKDNDLMTVSTTNSEAASELPSARNSERDLESGVVPPIPKKRQNVTFAEEKNYIEAPPDAPSVEQNTSCWCRVWDSIDNSTALRITMVMLFSIATIILFVYILTITPHKNKA